MNQDIHALAQVVQEAQRNETLWREQQAEAEEIVAALQVRVHELTDQVEGLEQEVDYWKRRAIRNGNIIRRMEAGEI